VSSRSLLEWKDVAGFPSGRDAFGPPRRCRGRIAAIPFPSIARRGMNVPCRRAPEPAGNA
jgi:hypothetical protein